MATKLDAEVVEQVWEQYRSAPMTELRNRLLENYLPLVKYNAERIWARLPEGVELDDLISASREGNPEIKRFECSVFTGEYITGDIDEKYLQALEHARNDAAKKGEADSGDHQGQDAVIGLHNDINEAV